MVFHVKGTMDYVKRYTEMLTAKSNQFELVNGVLFIRRDRWITPIGPAAQAFHVDKVQCRELLHKLGGLWVMWTDGFQLSDYDSDWYSVICRKHNALEDITDGKRRSELRRALRECEVCLVDAEEIALKGYETYCAALQSYHNNYSVIPEEQEFRRRVMTDAPFGDVRHQWGVYCDGKMVGFGQNLLYDKIEVDYTQIKLHPQYMNRYSAYALIYKMNEYYLMQHGFQYVNDGFRSIAHETGIQDFLIKKFGFEKAYTGLNVYYRPPIGQLLQMAHPFRAIATSLYPKADAIFELDRLRIRP